MAQNKNHGMIHLQDGEECVRVSAHNHGKTVWVDTSLFPHITDFDKQALADGSGWWPAPHDYSVMDSVRL